MFTMWRKEDEHEKENREESRNRARPPNARQALGKFGKLLFFVVSWKKSCVNAAKEQGVTMADGVETL